MAPASKVPIFALIFGRPWFEPSSDRPMTLTTSYGTPKKHGLPLYNICYQHRHPHPHRIRSVGDSVAQANRLGNNNSVFIRSVDRVHAFDRSVGPTFIYPVSGKNILSNKHFEQSVPFGQSIRFGCFTRSDRSVEKHSVGQFGQINKYFRQILQSNPSVKNNSVFNRSARPSSPTTHRTIRSGH